MSKVSDKSTTEIKIIICNKTLTDNVRKYVLNPTETNAHALCGEMSENNGQGLYAIIRQELMSRQKLKWQIEVYNYTQEDLMQELVIFLLGIINRGKIDTESGNAYSYLRNCVQRRIPQIQAREGRKNIYLHLDALNNANGANNAL